MPLQATSGAASYDAFGGGVPVAVNYIEEVFQTWLYSGNSSTQTITNGIDLSTKGGMVWTKSRNAAYDNTIYDTARGTGNNKALYTDTTDAEGAFTSFQDLTAYNTNGYSIGSPILLNETGKNYVSWTFRKQPKFFDVLTYSGTGSLQTISHNLGSEPGCIIIKRTSSSGTNWTVYHRSLGNTKALRLNTNEQETSSAVFWNNTSPTSTVFTVNTNSGVNASGESYVAYLWAHDSGGFGLTGTDNVVSCGSFTTDSSGDATVSLGYEPQWLMTKSTNLTDQWYMLDSMRGWPVTTASTKILAPNLADAETTGTFGNPTATGFTIANGGAAKTYVYVAIRRGPMKVPTSGTSVFGLNARTGTGAVETVTGSAGVSDVVLIKNRGSAVASLISSRLTGTGYLVTSSNAAQVAAGATILQANPWDVMDGVKVGTTSTITNASANTYINYLLDRAPSFFDVVCLSTAPSSSTPNPHNLGAVPELIIAKNRAVTGDDWAVYSAARGQDKFLQLNTTGAEITSAGAWGSVPQTSTNFYINGPSVLGSQGIFYLFATCAGVSKVGSYTGNGSTQTIDCGFGAGGARFVLIKRADATGDWYLYDTARGMTVLTDPYWLANSSAAEAATLGSVTTVSTGFAVNSTILAAINVSSGSYIFLAIA